MPDMEFDDRYITPEYTPLDNDIELSLRPRTMEDYIGQEKVNERNI